MSGENERTKDRHVAVVGETGAGKSTLVNFLTGADRAQANNNVIPCTEEPEPHPMRVDSGATYTIWDTRGWNEALGEDEAMGPLARFLDFLFGRVPEAERNLLKFLRSKDHRISLVPFCVEARKIEQSAEWKNYKRIFVKFGKKRRVKVAVVVTQMDGTTRNSEWKDTCLSQIEKVVGVKLDEKLVEAGDRDRRNNILRLIYDFS